jgi:uncharacterized membrane protein YccC
VPLVRHAANPFETAMSQPPSFRIRHAALVFALRTFAAAMLAFAIALDMPRPCWAMASVYITSNQLTGATWSKAVYRMLGTLIGAAGVIALIPNLVDAPELLSFAIALWVGLGSMLAIYTAVQLALNSSLFRRAFRPVVYLQNKTVSFT